MPATRQAVLVVEDDPLLRMAASDMVEAAGFAALEAANAREAIAVLEARDDVCIVFSDIDLSDDMDGLRLVALVRDRWPPIHIIVTSGKVVPDKNRLPADARFFAKPYREGDVVSAMRTMAA